MKALVTGAAGFVGSHLCAHLLDAGDEVHGLDSFTDFYPATIKRLNVAPLSVRDGFSLTEGDLLDLDAGALLADVDVVYHLAGRPAVRPSWGSNFASYVRNNLEATQRLLEAARGLPLRKIVYASSSSVYGNAERLPTSERVSPQPISPYGVTKLAAEHLCELYRANFGTPTVSLRLFTAYGPRQRPDMAFSRLFAALRTQTPFGLYGDGTQTRDFTYVGDVVRAMRDAALSEWCGVANIGGGARVSMLDVVGIIREEFGPVEVVRQEAQKGDARHTGADITVAAEAFGYAAQVALTDGLRRMAAWALETEEARAS